MPIKLGIYRHRFLINGNPASPNLDLYFLETIVSIFLYKSFLFNFNYPNVFYKVRGYLGGKSPVISHRQRYCFPQVILSQYFFIRVLSFPTIQN